MTSDDTQSRLAQLGDTLLKQTQAGAIEWRATDDEQAFLYRGSRGSIIVRREWNERAERSNCFLTVLNTRGTEIESLGEGTVKNEQGRVVAAGHNKMLRELYQHARRSALKIDEVIEGLLEEVKNPNKPVQRRQFNDEPPF
jgi:hypothetical protein